MRKHSRLERSARDEAYFCFKFVETNINSYTVYLNANQELKITSTAITGVSDRTVSVGSEEYGAEEIGNLAVVPGGRRGYDDFARFRRRFALTGNTQTVSH